MKKLIVSLFVFAIMLAPVLSMAQDAKPVEKAKSACCKKADADKKACCKDSKKVCTEAEMKACCKDGKKECAEAEKKAAVAK